MTLAYQTHDGLASIGFHEQAAADWLGDPDTDVVDLIDGFAAVAPAPVRRQLGLPARASVARALAAIAGLAADALEPLRRVSHGIYAEDDYLADLGDDADEHGGHAAAVVAANHAAWMPASEMLAALDAAIAALDDDTRCAPLFKKREDDAPPVVVVLGLWRRAAAAAIAAGAIELCVERDAR